MYTNLEKCYFLAALFLVSILVDTRALKTNIFHLGNVIFLVLSHKTLHLLG